jgi:transcriptional regulator with XRE-family HTH domain
MGYPTARRTLGDHLRARRMDLELTQLEVAARLGVTRESVDNWERDVHPPKGMYRKAIHDFLRYRPGTA